jgi:hypothetical protein
MDRLLGHEHIDTLNSKHGLGKQYCMLMCILCIALFIQDLTNPHTTLHCISCIAFYYQMNTIYDALQIIIN